ncbi:hypothetical protein EGW08_008283 [Elysia chlorotica]|uniref:Uncharacterized protein n=1 Tax=Elysia chlorotica TaxID=188477 RepID=A0A3S1BHE1_ELYCH|nr:hypothetical protein EGW08_008283 [Elysia chlorotica]
MTQKTQSAMRRKHLAMRSRKRLPIAAILSFSLWALCVGGGQGALSGRHPSASRQSGYLKHRLESPGDVCSYRAFSEPSEDIAVCRVDSIEGYRVRATSPRHSHTLDYSTGIPAEGYYCDPTSSNCPPEPGAIDALPVVMARKDIVLPRDVTSLTVNIVLDFEAYVEFHEPDEEEEMTGQNQLSLTLTANRGDNHDLSAPALNYRMASLGSVTEVMVFVIEASDSQMDESPDIYPDLPIAAGFLCLLVAGLVCGSTLPGLGVARVRILVYTGRRGQEKSAKSNRINGQAITTEAGQAKHSDTVTPELSKNPICPDCRSDEHREAWVSTRL